MVTVKDILELRKRMTLHDTNIVRIAEGEFTETAQEIEDLLKRS